MTDKREIRLAVSEKELVALLIDLKGRQMHANVSQQLTNELIRITEDNGAPSK
jgi:hypothetical protein